MADTTTLNVSVNKSSSETLSNGQVLWKKQVSITLPNNGSDAVDLKILASSFGLSSIEDVSTFVSSVDDEMIIAAPSVSKTSVLLSAGATGSPSAYSGTYNCVVRGYA